ncbi:MAG: hypothetical protein JO332_00175 [Planctomycetaceae bacterium]|nr:hypothetical protein [Planctomycetaceae bacterium]
MFASFSPWAVAGDPAVLVLCVLVLLVVFLIVVSAINVHTETDLRIRGLAESLGGRTVGGDVFGLPDIVFPVPNGEGLMRFAPGRFPSTTLEVRLFGFPEGVLRLSPESVGKSFLKMTGARDVLIGDSVFDATHFVESSPESLARRVFAPERRAEVVASIRRISSLPGFVLEARAGWLRIRVSDVVRDVPVALALKRTAVEFMDYLNGAGQVAGMQFAEPVERPTGRCPICATALVEPLVRCHRCRSPHHKECWDYAGRCATYGCDPRPRRRAA